MRKKLKEPNTATTRIASKVLTTSRAPRPLSTTDLEIVVGGDQAGCNSTVKT